MICTVTHFRHNKQLDRLPHCVGHLGVITSEWDHTCNHWQIICIEVLISTSNCLSLLVAHMFTWLSGGMGKPCTQCCSYGYNERRKTLAKTIRSDRRNQLSQLHSQFYPLTQSLLPFSPRILAPISAIHLIKAEPWAQWASDSHEDWHCFDISLLPPSMYRVNFAHNHWYLIAQT